MELIATAAFGLEALVADELRQLGYTDLMVENGRVCFRGDLDAICQANIHLRIADRVLVKVGEFQATSFEELFQGTRSLPWTDWLPGNANFPVNGKSVRSQLHSVPDCQAIVKKAIVEKMKQQFHREWFDETGPRFTIEVSLLKDLATLTIDTSGTGLHKRGYRKLMGQAPLRETLAAALVVLSRWNPDRPLIDPLCGSGTIPIEAALIGQNIAPGLERNFAAEDWPVLPQRLWDLARHQAREQINRNREFRIIASDLDAEALSLAGYHARQAGVAHLIKLEQKPVADVASVEQSGSVICNPPYGERVGTVQAAENLYREMGRVFARLPNWSYYILSAHPNFEQLFARKADKKRKLYNGRIQCHFYQYYGSRTRTNG